MTNLILPTLIMATIATIVAITALVIVLAMKFSTHQISWKPLVEEKLEEELQDVDVLFPNEEEELAKALKLQKSKKEKKEEDPLDEILQTNNF